MSIFKRNSIIFLLFVVLTLIFTFPLTGKLFSYFPGFQSTDETYGALWNFWWLKYAWQNHQPDTSCTMIAAPFGIDSSGSGYPIWNFINKWLTILTSNIFAYNAEVLIGFLLSAMFMYFLAFYLSQDTVCSVFSAVLYAFCPYHFVRNWQHLGLGQIQWMPLYILALFKLRKNPDSKHVILATIALFLVFSFDLYYAYFMLIVTALFVIFLLAKNRKDKIRVISRLFIAVFLVFLLISPSVYQIFKSRPKYASKEASAHNPFVRPFEDLFAQSARPLSYFLPATVHPLFGQFTEGFLGSPLYGESLTEHTLYLGWLPLILVFVAIRERRRRREQLPENENFNTGFFIFMAFSAWIFSQPPWWNIFGFKLYMPTFFLYKILPMFRAYCRFGIVVMLAVAVLAGIGLKFILGNLGDKKKKNAFAVFAFVLVLFEFWNYPPYKVIDVAQFPAVYDWLKEQPGDFIVAEYPLDAGSPNEMYKFYQTRHEKKIINGTLPGTYANGVAGTITKLSDFSTAGVLKWLGVKYILVHHQGYLKTGLVEEKVELNKISGNKGIRLIRSFAQEACPQDDMMCIRQGGPVDVYEVIAPAPIEPEAKK